MCSGLRSNDAEWGRTCETPVFAKWGRNNFGFSGFRTRMQSAPWGAGFAEEGPWLDVAIVGTIVGVAATHMDAPRG